MGLTHLLDTDTCIEVIRYQRPNLLRRIQASPPGSLGISTITLSELRFGADRSADPAKNHQALDRFTLPLEIADYNAAAALTYGQIRARMAKAGTPIGPLDTLIAAHARSLNVVLVTNNRSEFCRVPGLRIESWK